MMHHRLTETETDKYVDWHRQKYYYHAEYVVRDHRYYVNLEAMTVFYLTEGRLSMVTNQIAWDGANGELYMKDKGWLPKHISEMYEKMLAKQVLS